MAVAVGIGRFAFTPLLPMMLHDGTIDLAHGSKLATANYLGYLIGALLCMVLPRLASGATMIRCGLAGTILLTLGQSLPWPAVWPGLRFCAGIASAMVFVFTSGWCMAHLAQRGKPRMGATIFTGPGAGIALSGLVASLLVILQVSATTAWAVFALLALLLSAIVWRVFRGPDQQPSTGAASGAETESVASTASSVPNAPRRAEPPAASTAEMAIFTLAYGIAGFGYIITATFLPVIARAALPGSVWLDLFWPILGLGVVTGALVAARIAVHIDPRLLLIACYLVQAFGVAFSLILPSLIGFILSSLLVGLPFTAISFFAMQDVRRLRPHHAARFMGLLTAAYGIGQIAGPPLAAHLLATSTSQAEGFAWSLGSASTALLIGAILYLIMRLCWPLHKGSEKKHDRQYIR
ncbi:MAG TPA: YbfB/YjiJ family MFS transporter [Dongiaceae bacterium]|nr:YbfB/YjiJ family MFS transporter [Dongiaceae bacterium]